MASPRNVLKDAYDRAAQSLQRVDQVSASDSITYDPPAAAICFGTAGALAFDDATGKSVGVVPSGVLAAGIWHPMGISKLRATGTTAANFLLGW